MPDHREHAFIPAILPLADFHQTTLVIFELKRHPCFSRFVWKYIRSCVVHTITPSMGISKFCRNRLRRVLSQAV
jgi:hypothetical protein